MRKLGIITTFILAVLGSAPVTASPLAQGDWYQIARMAPDGNMFDGNGNLQSTYSFGTFTSQNQADDFARPFDTYDGMQILFITGNEATYGLGSYAALRQAIDAQASDFSVNYTWDQTSLGSNIGANVLSRPSAPEDPWITLVGNHSFGVNNASILWGEAGWPGPVGVRQHISLMMANNGVNVFVSVAAVPLPAALPAFGAALAVFAAFGWRRRRRADAQVA